MKTFTPKPYQLTHPLHPIEALTIKDQVNRNGARNVASLKESKFYYHITNNLNSEVVKRQGFAVMITGNYWKDCKDWVCYNCKFRIMGKD